MESILVMHTARSPSLEFLFRMHHRHAALARAAAAAACKDCYL